MSLRRPFVPVVVMSAACGSTPPSAVSAPTPSASAASPRSTAAPADADAEPDPVPMALTAQGIIKHCDDHLAAAQKLLEQMKALRGASADKLTYDATLGRFDDIVSEVSTAGE